MNIITVGKYQLGKKIGSGSFGDIFQCIFEKYFFFIAFKGVNTQTGEEFAIKIVK